MLEVGVLVDAVAALVTGVGAVAAASLVWVGHCGRQKGAHLPQAHNNQYSLFSKTIFLK